MFGRFGDGRGAAPEASLETTASIATALGLLREVWEENDATYLNAESQLRLTRLNTVLDEYDLPTVENPRQRQRAKR
jgi:hypothetical protein